MTHRIDVAVWIARKEHDILAVRSHGNDVYFLPGGMVEPDERPVEAASREVSEEIGHELDAGQLTHLGTLTEPAFGRPGVTMSLHCFIGGPIPTTLTLQAEEIAEAVWLPLTQPDRFAPAIRKALQLL